MSSNRIVNTLTRSNLFSEGQSDSLFVGRPYHINYNKASLLVCDDWKNRVKGIPQGSFLLAFYDNPRHDEQIDEALLLRVLNPAPLPTDNMVVASMVEYYKDNLKTSGKQSELDDFTRYEFSFSGLECRVLGTFYIIGDKIEFGADVENFYSSHNYKVFKATNNVLEFIVNQRDKDISHGNENEYSIGHVRYSSTKRFVGDETGNKVSVFINPGDLLGKRTSLFGMTRTGKSNTVKKVIQATVEISRKATYDSLSKMPESENVLEPIDPSTSAPKVPVGQIIFDINGEYANPNLQDSGTAIYEMYRQDTIRYSVIDKTKDGFKVLKVNFYSEVQAGFELIRVSFSEDKSDYIRSLCAIDLNVPEGYNKPTGEKTSDERNAANLYDRKKALYLACLKAAEFTVPTNLSRVKFYGDAKTVSTIIPTVKTHEGISLDQAVQWFSQMYEAMGNPDSQRIFDAYRTEKGFEYFDEDMKALLVFLTRKRKPTDTAATLSGYRKLSSLKNLHTATQQQSFEADIIRAVRNGQIVIIDLSQGDPMIQALYSEKICKAIFNDSMRNFINNEPNNFVQFYFEEAHNLFPKKEDKDLSQIYNRLAKEGAKLGLGMTYATQEVSSISSNILKNTQNWFIAHLNNEDETREIRKYYDFEDFTDALTRFSARNDKGFVRMKTYSNPFVIPVQIDKFQANN